MAENIGTGIVEIKADTKGLGKDIESGVDAEGKHVDTAGSKMGKRLGQAFTAAAGVFAIAAAAEFVNSTITAASDLAESANAVNVTFGAAAGGISKLGQEAATAVGLSTTEFNGLAVRFSSFATTVAGAGGDVVGTMDDMTTRAADFASVMNIDVAQAAELFQSGLAGESEPLRKYGLDLSAAAVEAFAVENGLIAAGEAMTEQAKVQARYGLLMEQTNEVAGDFANTSDGLANQQRIMAAQFENAKAKLGEALMPVMASAVEFITTYVIPNFKTIGIVLATILVPAVIAWAVSMGAAAVATIAATWPILAIIAAIAALAAGVIYAYTHWDWFRTAVDAVATFITDTLVPAFQSAVAWIQEHIIPAIVQVVIWINDNLVPAFQAIARFIMGTVVPAFQTMISVVLDKIIPAIANIITKFNEVASAVGTKVGEIVGFIVGIPDRIGSTIASLWEGLKTKTTEAKDWVRSAIDEVVGFARGLPGRINGFFSGMWDGIKDAFKSALNSVIRGWNSLEFAVPGVSVFGKTIGGVTIGTPDIGYLATGGVIGRPTIAMIGEAPGARRNPEIVSPVNLMADTFRDVLNGSSGGATRDININHYGQTVTPATISAGLAMARMSR